MQKLTILFLILIIIIFNACSSQPEPTPQPKDKRAQLLELPRPKEKPDEIFKLGQILSNGTRMNITYEIYGPLPCDVAHKLGRSCLPSESPEPTEKPRKITPTEQRDSINRKNQ